MWHNITIHDLVFMSKFSAKKKQINNFYVLTFIQVSTDKNKDKMGAYK